MNMSYPQVKGRRMAGGAVVTVTRPEGQVHRYKVSLKRYHRLKDTLNSHPGIHGGWTTSNGFCFDVRDATGLAATCRWAARQTYYGAPKRWWK